MSPLQQNEQNQRNPFITIDTDKLKTIPGNFISGLGLLLVYIFLLSIGSATATLCFKFAFNPIISYVGHSPYVGYFLIVLIAAVCIGVWWLSCCLTFCMLEDLGIEIGITMFWILLPIAPVVVILLTPIIFISSLAEKCSSKLRLVGFIFGIIILLSGGITLIAYLF